MKKIKKFVIIIFASIVVAAIFNILFFSDFSFDFIKSSWKKNLTEKIDVSTSELYDLKSESDYYYTLSDDSRIVFDNLNGTLYSVNSEIASSCDGTMEVFYTTNDSSDFSSHNSMSVNVSKGVHTYDIYFGGINVYDLRIDPTDSSNCKLNFSDILVSYSDYHFNILSFLNFDRILILTIVVLFVLCNFLYDRNKLYSFIFRKRYFIGLLLFIISVVFKYNGSSILLMNNYIQPNIKVDNQQELFGKSRIIRSDEWNVNTPYTLSQLAGDKKFSYFNDNFRAEPTDMYVISLSAPIRDIVAVSKPFSWGYFFLGAERGFSFWWVGRLSALFLVTIDFGMLITKKNSKLSVALSFLVTFGSATQWWYSTYLIEFLIFGQLCVVLLDKYLFVKRKKCKFLLASFLSISMLGFVSPLYPAWEFPLAFVFGYMGICLLVNYLRNNKFQKFDYIMLIYIFIFVGCILLRFILLSKGTIDAMSSTVYPGARFTNGGGGFARLFNFYPSLFYSFTNVVNPCEPSGYFCLFPLPIFVAIYCIIKEIRQKKTDVILLGLTFLSIFYSCFCIFGFPNFLAKISLLYLSLVGRIVVVVQLLCVYLMIICLSKIEKNLFKHDFDFLILFLIVIYCIFTIFLTIGLNDNYFGIKTYILSFAILTLYVYAFINSTGNKNILFVLISILISVMTGVFVNPIIKGLNIVYDKPLSHEVVKLNNHEPGKWLVLGSTSIPNYIAIQGVSVINTVNNYPSLERMSLIDPDRKYEQIYNRYAHICVNLTEEQTSFVLVQPDFYILNLSIDDVYKLDIKYIVSETKINYKKMNLKERYNEDGIYIYSLEVGDMIEK